MALSSSVSAARTRGGSWAAGVGCAVLVVQLMAGVFLLLLASQGEAAAWEVALVVAVPLTALVAGAFGLNALWQGRLARAATLFSAACLVQLAIPLISIGGSVLGGYGLSADAIAGSAAYYGAPALSFRNRITLLLEDAKALRERMTGSGSSRNARLEVVSTARSRSRRRERETRHGMKRSNKRIEQNASRSVATRQVSRVCSCAVR